MSSVTQYRSVKEALPSILNQVFEGTAEQEYSFKPKHFEIGTITVVLKEKPIKLCVGSRGSILISDIAHDVQNIFTSVDLSYYFGLQKSETDKCKDLKGKISKISTDKTSKIDSITTLLIDNQLKVEQDSSSYDDLDSFGYSDQDVFSYNDQDTSDY